ncbi:hypothetical protein [Inquilinus limosus]|uniref:hypothetical protein n=1 Tax=Inquilinus limosus TaxID=171674 RepID=UPI0004200DE2|nr:hypothetical protein [Inquilinus limosus]
MSDKPSDLPLEHLRRLHAGQSRILEVLGEHGHRLARIETAIAGLRREQAGDAETIAHLEARLDRLREEIDRIKQRLDLVD